MSLFFFPVFLSFSSPPLFPFSPLEKKKERRTILGRVLDPRHQHRPLRALGAVELEHLLEREVADDVGVEHEEGVVAAVALGGEDRAREAEGARGAHGLVLLGAGDLDAELRLPLLEEVHHDLKRKEEEVFF